MADEIRKYLWEDRSERETDLNNPAHAVEHDEYRERSMVAGKQIITLIMDLLMEAPCPGSTLGNIEGLKQTLDLMEADVMLRMLRRQQRIDNSQSQPGGQSQPSSLKDLKQLFGGLFSDGPEQLPGPSNA